MNETAHFPVSAPFADEIMTLLGGLRLLASDEYVMHPGLSSVLLRPYWLLEIIVEGEMQLMMDNGSTVNLRAGTGVLYLPQSRCRENVPDKPRACRSQTIIFQDDNDQFRARLRAGGSYLGIEDNNNLLQPLIEATMRGFHSGLTGVISAVGRFYQVIALLLAARQKRDDVLSIEPETTPFPLVLQAHRFMSHRLPYPISIRDIARHMKMSESGFAHAYRRLTGRTPMAALRAMRVEAVRHELLRGRYNLNAVAKRTGFADASHLSRTFKQLVGQSPRDFLQRHHPNRPGRADE